MKNILDEILDSPPAELEDEFFADLLRRTRARVRRPASVAPAPACKYVITTPVLPPAIGFEFDLNYGATKELKPSEDPEYSLEGKKITNHRKSVHGFRVKGDGNRIEIATVPFELTASGQTKMQETMGKVLAFTRALNTKCARTKPDRSLGYSKKVGDPIYFAPPLKKAGVKSVFPLSFYPKKGSYYGKRCRVGAAPQATLTLPLAKVNQFVTLIKRSERKYGHKPGYAFSGPAKSKSGRYLRKGVRSKSLYDAQRVVNRSRSRHIRRKTRLSDGSVVDAANFSKTLQGFLILMVSYLKSGLPKYVSNGDYEIFAKSYLPLNVKHPFRLLYKDLTKAEKAVFKGLYYNASTKNIWRLADGSAKASAKNRQLFPAKVKGHQEGWFNTAPTWGEFLHKTVNNIPLITEKHGSPGEDKGEKKGCEVLWAPLSSIIPHQPGSRRVTVEMRRLGFDWVRSERWAGMTKRLFLMAQKLNK